MKRIVFAISLLGLIVSCKPDNNPVQETVPADAVDLGITITRKDGTTYTLYWAKSNLSVNGLCANPEDHGDYYAWGETEPYYSNQDPLTWKNGKTAGYDWASYKWCKGVGYLLTRYCPELLTEYWSGTDTPDNKTEFVDYNYADDAARARLGGKWRMPTDAEWTALQDNCTWTWTTQNGVNGRLVTAPNGNSIFLPAAGDRGGASLYDAGSYGIYWSSSLDAGDPRFAWRVCFYSDDVGRWEGFRYGGMSVRPVWSAVDPDKGGVNVVLPDDVTVTGEATAVTEWSVQLAASANVPAEAGSSWENGFLVSKQANPSQDAQARKIAANQGGNYSKKVTQLSSETTYYYQSFFTLGGETRYGEVKSFQTKKIAAPNIWNTNFQFTGASFSANVKINTETADLPVQVYFLWAFDEEKYYTLDELKSGACLFYATLENDVATANLYQSNPIVYSDVELYFGGYHSYAVCVDVWDKMFFGTASTKPIWVSEPASGIVDMGLSVKWRSSVMPGFFAWGELNYKDAFTSANYTYKSNPSVLPLSADAAHQYYVEEHWRLPTAAEFQELLDNCPNIYWGMYKDTHGKLFISKKGTAIFLPARGYSANGNVSHFNEQGYYWTSDIRSGNNSYAKAFVFSKTSTMVSANGMPRWNGLSLYAVYDENTH